MQREDLRMSSPKEVCKESLITGSVDIVSAYVGRNDVIASDLPQIIRSVYMTLGSLAGGGEERGVVEAPRPAIHPRRSITPEYLVCLEDGKRFKSLKRHLRTRYNLSPEAYREKWSLPADYPMVAPKYAEARSALAKRMGLGQKR